MNLFEHTKPEPLPDFLAYIHDIPELSPAERAELESAGAALENDADFHAELLKSKFAESMLSALEERQESKSELAKRWGRSRQYVSKILHAHERVNLTIQTMVEIAFQLGKQVDIVVSPFSANQNSTITTTTPGGVGEIAAYFRPTRTSSVGMVQSFSNPRPQFLKTVTNSSIEAKGEQYELIDHLAA